jgi:hypothetical protein
MTQPNTEVQEAYTIWTGFTTFRKNGSPIMGTLGSSAKQVVVMEADTFRRICREHPTLGTALFRVGEL